MKCKHFYCGPCDYKSKCDAEECDVKLYGDENPKKIAIGKHLVAGCVRCCVNFCTRCYKELNFEKNLEVKNEQRNI